MIGIAIVIVMVLYLIDRNQVWRQVYKLTIKAGITLAVLVVLAVGGRYVWGKYETWQKARYDTLARQSGAIGSYLAILRNGFSIRHERREVIDSTTRLYLSGEAGSYVDVPTTEIERFEINQSDMVPVPQGENTEQPPPLPPGAVLGVHGASEADNRPPLPEGAGKIRNSGTVSQQAMAARTRGNALPTCKEYRREHPGEIEKYLDKYAHEQGIPPLPDSEPIGGIAGVCRSSW